MRELFFHKTIEREGNDCQIIKDAHVVEILSGEVVGYVATCSTIYRGWMGFDTRSQSFVYDKDHLDEAIQFCEEFLKDY